MSCSRIMSCGLIDDLFIESTEEFERVLTYYLSLNKTGIEFKIPNNVDASTFISEIIDIISEKTNVNKTEIAKTMYSNNQLYVVKINY